MKYKDIANLFPNLSKLIKNRIILRFFRCVPEIKKEIRDYLETGNMPLYKTKISIAGKEITLSVYELVNNYHMTPLDALIFIDEFLQPKADKQQLLNSLVALRVSEARPQVDLEYLQRNVDPEVKKQAEKIRMRMEQTAQSIEKEVSDIEDNEIE